MIETTRVSGRELKFRAWDKKHKRMSLPADAEQIFGKIWVPFDVTEFDLMQYTGLKDKNGKEVYEGDILSLPFRFEGDYSYKPSIAVVEWDVYGWYVNNRGECGYNETEVIGNIYENPELLAKE